MRLNHRSAQARPSFAAIYLCVVSFALVEDYVYCLSPVWNTRITALDMIRMDSIHSTRVPGNNILRRQSNSAYLDVQWIYD